MSKYILITGDVHSDLSSGQYSDAINEKPIDSFGPIASVNVLVGANNSGKSRFLRGLLKTESYLVANNDACYHNLELLKNRVEKLQSEYTDANYFRFEIPKVRNYNDEYILNDSHRHLIERAETSGNRNSTVVITRDYFRGISGCVDHMLLNQKEVFSALVAFPLLGQG